MSSVVEKEMTPMSIWDGCYRVEDELDEVPKIALFVFTQGMRKRESGDLMRFTFYKSSGRLSFPDILRVMFFEKEGRREPTCTDKVVLQSKKVADVYSFFLMRSFS